MPQFEALHAQVVGVSADHVATLDAFTKQNKVRLMLASDFRRTMLPAYDALVTDAQHPFTVTPSAPTSSSTARAPCAGSRSWTTPSISSSPTMS